MRMSTSSLLLAGQKCINIHAVKHISFLGMEIDIGCVVVVLGSLGQKFYRVNQILVESSAFSIVGQKLFVEYVHHFDSYHIVSCSDKEKKFLQADVQCPTFKITFSVRLNSDYFICKKWP